MCGIAGGWFLVKKPQLQDKIQSALHSMKLRGPNDEGRIFFEASNGIVALGHTRLSIIDLTSSGHQPMKSSCGNYTIVFNGEIYNYLELKAELKNFGVTFSTNSDTEVLLAAWIYWGVKCLRRLVGMFAFSIFDAKNQTLTCARDAFGIKPMFLTNEPSGFAFASELWAIKALKTNKCELNWQRSYDYLVFGQYDNDYQTFVADVHHLLPGHLVVFDVKTKTLKKPLKWWNPKISPIELSFDNASDSLREKFLSNINLHLRSDVPVGAALSGGLDSSAVVCAIRHIDSQIPINTFSYIAGRASLSEEHWIDQISSHVGAISHKVFVSSEEMAEDLDDMIKTQGEPFGSTSIYAQYRVFKEAKLRGVTVTLDGQGADELLGGYSGYPGQRMHSLIEEREFSQALNFLVNWSKWPGRNLSGGMKRLIGELSINSSFYSILRKLNGDVVCPPWIDKRALIEHGVQVGYSNKNLQADDHGRRLVSALREALTSDGLPSLLRHADRNSMRFSVESRVPFLTIEMAEFLLSLPEDFLVSRDGETKHVFRAAMRGIVPENILYRRDKIGFETPEAAWLIKLLPTFRLWLEQDLKIPFLKHEAVLRYMDSIVNTRSIKNPTLWRLVNFYRWHSQFF